MKILKIFTINTIYTHKEQMPEVYIQNHLLFKIRIKSLKTLEINFLIA